MLLEIFLSHSLLGYYNEGAYIVIDDFEDGAISGASNAEGAEWDTSDVSNNWYVSSLEPTTSEACSGNYSLKVVDSDSNSADGWFWVSSRDNPGYGWGYRYFSFYAKASAAGVQLQYEVKVPDDDHKVTGEITLTTSWQQYKVDISSYSTSGYVGSFTFNLASDATIYIDNITLVGDMVSPSIRNQDLTATPIYDGGWKVELALSNFFSDNGDVKVNVYRDTSPITDVTTATLIASNLTFASGEIFYNDTSVTAGTTYYYAVVPVDEFGVEFTSCYAGDVKASVPSSGTVADTISLLELGDNSVDDWEVYGDASALYDASPSLKISAASEGSYVYRRFKSVEPWKKYYLRFTARASSEASLTVSVLFEDGSVGQASFNLTTTSQEYSCGGSVLGVSLTSDNLKEVRFSPAPGVTVYVEDVYLKVDQASPSFPSSVNCVREPSTNYVYLSWGAAHDNETGVKGYRIYRRVGADPTVSDAYLVSDLVTGTSWVDTSAPTSTDVRYAVVAVDYVDNNCGVSSQNTVSVDVPSPPDVSSWSPSLAAVYNSTTGSVDLNWSSWTGFDSFCVYRIYRRVDSPPQKEPFYLYAETTSPSFKDYQVEPGSKYCYAISVYDKDGDGDSLEEGIVDDVESELKVDSAWCADVPGTLFNRKVNDFTASSEVLEWNHWENSGSAIQVSFNDTYRVLQARNPNDSEDGWGTVYRSLDGLNFYGFLGLSFRVKASRDCSGYVELETESDKKQVGLTYRTDWTSFVLSLEEDFGLGPLEDIKSISFSVPAGVTLFLDDIIFLHDAAPPREPVLSSTVTGKNVVLSWTGGEDNFGVREYRVYRNASPDFSRFQTLTPVAVVNTTSWTDEGAFQKAYFYVVVAVDFSGRVSKLSNVVASESSMIAQTDSSGGYVFASSDSRYYLKVPKGAFSSVVNVELLTPLDITELPKENVDSVDLLAFCKVSFYSQGKAVEPSLPFELHIPYKDINGKVEGTFLEENDLVKRIQVYWFDGKLWIPVSFKVDTDSNTFVVQGYRGGYFVVKIVSETYAGISLSPSVVKSGGRVFVSVVGEKNGIAEKVSVYSVSGKKVLVQDVSGQNFSVLIPEDLPCGAYILKVECTRGDYLTTFVIFR